MSDKSHKLAAIVFTDIVGYTKSMEEDEQKTMQLLQKQRDIISPLIETHKGKVIKEIGDGFLMMFKSAIQAVRFTIDLQKQLKQEELTVRACIHIGDVIIEKKDVFGSAVNMAARLEPIAPPNGICVSEDVRNQIRNKENIETKYIGCHELKGIDEPVKVYLVNPDEFGSESEINFNKFIKDLWDRRIFHILAGYLIFSFLIKLSVTAIVYRYLLSPHLIELTWIILLSMLPTVFILAYFHGRKGKHKWNKTEIIGLPVNLLASALLLVIMFNGKDLGAATTSLPLENEDGEIIEHTVIKNEFQKKLALFFYENISDDTSLYWMQYAIPSMLDYDLSQNMFIQAQCASAFINKFKDAGFEKGVGAPLMFQRNIAAYFNLNYFVTGQIDFKGGQYILLTKLYKTEDGVLVSEFKTTGTDFFNLIDEVTKFLYSELEIPSEIPNKSKDFPLTEIYTPSIIAAEYYNKGNIEVILNSDWEKATYFTEIALQEDTSFAIALLMLAEHYFYNGQLDLSEVNLKKTIKVIYKLPERSQFFTKFFYYVVKQEPDKAIAVLKVWTELFPEDIEAHDILAERYQYKNMYREAIEEYRKILAIDPDQAIFIRYIGNLYEVLGNSDSAIDYYKQYIELHPDDYKSYQYLGKLYLDMGEFELTVQYLDRAQIMEPTNIDISLTRIEVDIKKGKTENIENEYLKLLTSSNSTNDSSSVYIALSDFYQREGKTKRSLLYFQKAIELNEKTAKPLAHKVQQVFAIDKYTLAGQYKEAQQLLKNIEQQLQSPIDKVVAFGYMFFYISIDSLDKAESYISKAKELAVDFGEESLLADIYYAQGKIYEQKSMFIEAIECYDYYEQKRPSESIVNLWKARCFRQINKNKEAEKLIEVAMKHDPYNPEINYEAAIIYNAKGKSQKAKEHLSRSLEVWKNADKDYKPAMNARETMVDLQV